MADSVAKIVKPQLRGLLHAQIKRTLALAIGISVGAGLLQKIFVNDARKKAYAEFYKNYDIMKEFHEIRKKGLFHSCK